MDYKTVKDNIMKKILFILVVASTLTQVAYSQKAVLDITCMETLIANHKVQHTSFSKVKENEAQNKPYTKTNQ